MIDLVELKNNIISCAKNNDADLIGFAGRERFKNSPLFEAYPEVKTVIGMAFRVLRALTKALKKEVHTINTQQLALKLLKKPLCQWHCLKLAVSWRMLDS